MTTNDSGCLLFLYCQISCIKTIVYIYHLPFKYFLNIKPRLTGLRPLLSKARHFTFARSVKRGQCLKLPAVSSPVSGRSADCSAFPPTDPDVRNSRIRLLEHHHSRPVLLSLYRAGLVRPFVGSKVRPVVPRTAR